MHTRRSPLSIALSLIIFVALMPVPCLSLLRSVIAQKTAERTPQPKPGKPEGTLPDLEEIQRESHLEREPPAPIPSTVRSSKVPERPWNGRRVGDPLPEGTLDHPVERGQMQRAHARRRVKPPPTLLDDQFVQNFFAWALLRSASSSEATFWNDQLRVAYAQGQTSVKLVGVALGKTLFESAEYAARNRDNHWHVYDLYKTFLMRDPDPSGWTYWENLLPQMGRENVRRGFEESSEFAGILASIVPNGAATANAASLITARIDPRNQPGHGMLARDATWSVPLLSLPGRNGLDLGLALSYSSQVWTRSGPYIHFDEDNGFPSPGFRLGFPVIQRKVFDAQTARNAFLLITPGGQRVELRQVGSSNIYEAADSSYLQLTDNSTGLLLRTTDGTQLSFSEIQNEFRCWQLKDRNGNYLTITNNALGQLTSITDTLGRAINFNYDTNANLISITQSWNGQPSHQWVSFGWSTRTMQSSFSNVAVAGTANGSIVPVITQVSVNDTSYFTFEYNNSLQVTAIRNYFGGVERNATIYTYETPASDVPRLLDSRVSAQNWTAVNGVPSQVITQYSVAADGACVLTAPDGTIYKEYYGAGWQKGLTTLSEVWSGGVRQKWTTTAWTQDNTAVSYEVNPRVVETNVYDASGNRRRTVIDYGQYAQYGLPYLVKEYAADGATVIRHTFTDYDLSQAYLERRIIGLVSALHLKDASNYESKITYEYDDPARLQSLPAAAVQHDNSYNTLLTVRGNVTAVSRWDVNDINNAAKKLTSYTNYYTTGSPKSITDPAGHQNSFTYTDSFADSVNRNTFAYPTTLTDADGFSSYVQYNFDIGSTTRTQSPAPAGQSQGGIQTMSYNNLGQLDRVTTVNNGAYKRFWYGPNYTASFATVNNVADELYSIAVVDGVGRVIGSTGNHPGSTGGYAMVSTIYDQMGRTVKVSNPIEINSSWIPSGDDAAGVYYTQQTYDWNGRPLITTNTDGTTKEASYSGCGCAGGAVVTLTDEGTIYAGVAKRRQQRIYSDVFGRTVKTEILNWQNGSAYSTTVNTYNARDQITEIRQYAGVEGSGTYQDTTFTYDGYGRLQSRRVPEQNAGTATTWSYNTDDTIQSRTDARGASTTFTYTNGRHLPNVVTHTLAGASTIVESFSYDAAANRISMSDSSGSTTYQYDQLSHLTSETRTFSGLGGSYTLGYDYHKGGQLKSITDHTNQRINYAYDNAGRLNSHTGTNYTYGQFINNISYRAWGGPKQISYGNGRTESVTYNSRLRASHYEIPAGGGFSTAASIDYQYYNDGRLKYSHDSIDSRFDRSYEYDHAARLTKALSGAEARGEPATTDRPYKETATYDAFNHLNTRSSKHWSRLLAFTSSDTYANNRRVGWTYDAEGNLLSGAGRQYTYDAAGRTTSTSWTGGYFNEFHDGDGRRVKAAQPNLATYYLRSTVLGGQVIEELNNTGAKQQSFIYIGQKIVGHDWANGNVLLLHEDPSGTSVHSSLPDSVFVWDFTDLDPWGAEIFSSDPYLQDPEFSGGRGESGPTYSGYGDISMPSNGCMLDGGYTLCEFLRNSESLAFQVTVGGKSKQFPLAPGLLGIFAAWVEDDGKKLTKRQTPNGSEFDEGDTIVTNMDSDGLGHWELMTLASPQNSYSQVYDKVVEVLKDSKCSQFTKDILSVISKKNPVYPEGGTLLDVFREFIKQPAPQSLFTTQLPKDSLGYGSAIGIIRKGTAQIALPGFPDADGIISELFHLAGGNKSYTDKQLAEAVRKFPQYAEVANKALDPSRNIYDSRYQAPSDWTKENEGGYSAYFHYAQYNICFTAPSHNGMKRLIR